MNIKKKILLTLSILVFFSFIFVKNSQAEEFRENISIEILFFGSPTCPHCLAEKQFLKELKSEYPDLIIKEYEFSQNTKLINDLYKEYNVPKNQQGLIPATFIDDSFFIGFNESIGQSIENKIKGENNGEISGQIKIPIFGEINVYNFSLPVLAIILGIVDGFNVCSLGALIIILGLVMVLKSRKRIFMIGGIFLLVTVLTYGLLIFMWYKFFSLISPYIKSMELLIGLLAIIAGAYLLKEFIKSLKQGATCNSGGIIGKLTPKVEKIFSTKKNIAILGGVVALFATAVTIIEFPCSAFLPVLFTSILVESGVSKTTSLLYIGIYLLLYMIDEVIIFLIAVLTMKIKIVSPKFINIFNLLAALIFLFLGAFYLFRVF